MIRKFLLSMNDLSYTNNNEARDDIFDINESAPTNKRCHLSACRNSVNN